MNKQLQNYRLKQQFAFDKVTRREEDRDVKEKETEAAAVDAVVHAAQLGKRKRNL